MRLSRDTVNRIYAAEDKARSLRQSTVDDDIKTLADAVAQLAQAVAEALKVW